MLVYSDFQAAIRLSCNYNNGVFTFSHPLVKAITSLVLLLLFHLTVKF